MIPISEEMVQEQRRHQMMATAENYRLVNRPNPGWRLRPAQSYHILLARLGDVLYKWGCSLRTHHRQLTHPAHGRT